MWQRMDRMGRAGALLGRAARGVGRLWARATFTLPFCGATVFLVLACHAGPVHSVACRCFWRCRDQVAQADAALSDGAEGLAAAVAALRQAAEEAGAAAAGVGGIGGGG